MPSSDALSDPTLRAALVAASARLSGPLAVAPVLPELLAALERSGAAVLHAPPGTGKTTAVPPALALSASSGGGRVVVTQPRRVAVRAAWRRLHGALTAAGLDGDEADAVAGYAVRGDMVGAGRSAVEFVTPGLLVRRLLADPALEGVGAVVLDEVHERDLDTDVLFALLADLRQLRPELTLTAMSATVDADALAARWARGMGEGSERVPVVRTPAVQHPLAVEHAPFAAPRLTPAGRVDRDFLEHVAGTAVRAHAAALAEDRSVDALVFLPGVAEVEAVAGRVAALAPGTEVLTLHGRQEPAEQDAALAGRTDPGRPRMVVTTAVAESSLTVPGVRLVVDSGLAREPRRDRGRGMTGLVTVQASQAAAGQRAGRAARLGPGTVVRCHTPAALGTAPAAPTPALAVADLSPVALAFAVWGAPRGEALVLPEDPPAGALVEAERRLQALGAVDGAGRVSAHGAVLARVPVDPALAHALLLGAAWVGEEPAAETVAALAAGLRAPEADLEALLRQLRAGRHPEAVRWRREADRLRRLARRHAPGQVSPALVPPVPADARDHPVGAVVALAAPERIARAVEGADVVLLASGTRAGLPAGTGLRTGTGLRAAGPWLAVAEADRVPGGAEGTGAVVRAAAPVGERTALAAGAALVQERTEAAWRGERLTARRRRLLGAVELSSTPAEVDLDTAAQAVRDVLASHALARFEADDAGRPGPGERLRRRVHLLHRVLGQPWPDLSGPALPGLEPLVAGLAAHLAAGRAARSADLTGLLRGTLPWPEAGRLEELAPERLPVPSGRAVVVDYPATDEDGQPVVAAKLQEFLGAAATPTVADGRVPVLLHLLSPAGRPLAVTADLPSFWAGPYSQVRAENRGRYPKHPWPEDPAAAAPTALTARALRGRATPGAGLV
ncbi:ATP-dependent helicase C-terminal domain-containing protein [Micrococcus sp.]|uniref:ATP-dependent helicase C-terminal domain-containing protein n=1 Tax=Micrococcus sp. TaxID=1271 RepID=UPI002A90B807|nr:ATP-dependent helicase C-terminal domain-containing protein [Micrococcus sp.]MDY6055735.1 ATP-dependent helicase C-terminal domain-containing protein [Micrococcus sp.]